VSRDKDPECRGVLIRESPAAICVAKMPLGAEEHWIPRSQIGYLRKTHLPSGTTEVVFTVPEWLIEKKQCWELVPW
jgi:hypothetical protein